MPLRLLKLDISKENAEHFYVGNVLDLISRYLGVEVAPYLVNCSGLLVDSEAARIHCNGERRIVYRKGKNKFVIDGFPEDKDFLDFRAGAQGMLEEFMKRNRKS